MIPAHQESIIFSLLMLQRKSIYHISVQAFWARFAFEIKTKSDFQRMHSTWPELHQWRFSPVKYDAPQRNILLPVCRHYQKNSTRVACCAKSEHPLICLVYLTIQQILCHSLDAVALCIRCTNQARNVESSNPVATWRSKAKPPVPLPPSTCCAGYLAEGVDGIRILWCSLMQQLHAPKGVVIDSAWTGLIRPRTPLLWDWKPNNSNKSFLRPSIFVFLCLVCVWLLLTCLLELVDIVGGFTRAG
jgi:hypothetical protein